MRNLIVLVLYPTLISCLATQRTRNVYRTDYEYNEETNAFYKFHTEPRQKSKAENMCVNEGGQLLKIESGDLTQIHAMFKKYPELTSAFAWVATDEGSYEPAEVPLIQMSEEVQAPSFLDCDVVSRSLVSIQTAPCYSYLPFFCKVKAVDAYYDPECKTYGKNYQFNQSLGSCYKVSSHSCSWNEAEAECSAEGAHLLVLNSVAESLAVKDLISGKTIDTARYPWFFFAGFRANRPQGNQPVVFKTIFNQTLEEAGFSQWAENEPNNAHSNEYCGSVFTKDGKLNDADCNHQFGFICEKEVTTHN